MHLESHIAKNYRSVNLCKNCLSEKAPEFVFLRLDPGIFGTSSFAKYYGPITFCYMT